MQLWTLAYHNRTGTGAILFSEESKAYQALADIVIQPTDTKSLLAARKMLLLRQFDDLCRWLQVNHFGVYDDYRIQPHELTLVPEES